MKHFINNKSSALIIVTTIAAINPVNRPAGKHYMNHS